MSNLNMQQLLTQLTAFSAAELRERPRRREALAEARKALFALHHSWHEQRQDQVHVPWLMARPLDNPTRAFDAGPRPTPLTAVATDGSQIFPDRHIQPQVYLLNIGQIAFQYGTLEPPEMSTATQIGTGHHEFAFQDAAGISWASAEVITALRDQLELSALLTVSEKARRPGRPIVALLDGTLIRWMLQRIDPRPLQSALIGRYAEQMAQFRERNIPLCSFISLPNSTEVTNLLRGLRGERRERRADTLAGVPDRSLFDPVIGPRQRTAAFLSTSHVLEDYHHEDRVCFFYVRVLSRGGASEIARVETPAWVAADDSLLKRVHATVVSECEKGDGYPVVLAEAHERAIVRTRDRTLFYDLVAREMARHEMKYEVSRKRLSKQRPAV